MARVSTNWRQANISTFLWETTYYKLLAEVNYSACPLFIFGGVSISEPTNQSRIAMFNTYFMILMQCF
jgi:hypothetical protein